MAFTAKDGSRFTNHSTYKQHEARSAGKSPMVKSAGVVAPAGDDDAGMDDLDDAQGQPEDGAAIAAEHGPATELTVHHDHEAGSHKVHASHPDGHTHDTEHMSADEAHKFLAECAGCGAGGGAGDAMGGGVLGGAMAQ